MPSLELAVTQTVNGIGVGAIYFLIAIGLSLIFGIMDFVNFAHGAFYTLGAYVGLELIQVTGSFWLALFIAPLAVGVLALVLERVLLQRTYGLDHTYQIILTFGVALIISELVIVLWSAHSQNVATPAALRGVLILGAFIVPEYRLFVIGLIGVIATILWFWLEKTRFGAKLRAGTESLATASAMGINVKRLFSITFAVGAALAALAGVLVAPIGNLDPFIGDRVLGLAFAVVVIGGMGSFVGALVAALLIGVIQSLTVMLWPLGGNVVVYLFMAIVLFTQRAGLFGRSAGSA